MVAAGQDMRSVIQETTHHYRLGSGVTGRPGTGPLGLSPELTAREVSGGC